MVWTIGFFVVLWLLLVTPVVGTALALMVIMVTIPVTIPVLKAVEPVTNLLMSNGMRGGLATLVAASLVVGPVVVACICGCIWPRLTAKTRRRWFYALIYAVAVPATIALAWWVLPNKFG